MQECSLLALGHAARRGEQNGALSLYFAFVRV